MIAQLRCLEDFTTVSIMNHVHDSVLTGFPTQLNSSLYIHSKNTNKDVIDVAFRQEWYNKIRENNDRVKNLYNDTEREKFTDNYQYEFFKYTYEPHRIKKKEIFKNESNIRKLRKFK